MNPTPFEFLGIHTHKNIGLQFVLKADKRLPDPNNPGKYIWVTVWDHHRPTWAAGQMFFITKLFRRCRCRLMSGSPFTWP